MTVLCHAFVLDRVVITADCYVREDVARQSYVYLSKHEFFSAFYWKTSLPYLLRGSPANMFGGLLISMQYVTACG